jgi:hypothetical protein
MAKKVTKRFSVSFNLTSARFTIDVKADTLEDAIAAGRALGVSKALQQFQKGKNAFWDDYEGEVNSVWENG